MKVKYLIGFFILLSMIFLVFSTKIFSLTVHDFRVNADSAEGVLQYHPDMAFDSLGNFVIVYQDRGVNSDFRQIYFQQFDSLANRLGEPILVSDTTIPSNNCPSIAMHPSGSFVISWYSSTRDPEWIYDIQVRRYDPSGNPLGPPQKVDVDRPDSLSVSFDPHVAMGGAGNFVVAWQDQEIGQHCWAQLFNASGERVGNNFFVSDPNTCEYRIRSLAQFPRVACNSQGYFLICWMGLVYEPKPSYSCPMGRVYNPLGHPLTGVFLLFTPGSQWDYGGDADITSNSQGNFITCFLVNDTLWTYPHNAVAVRTFDTLGNPLTEVKIVNDVIDLGNSPLATRVATDDLDGYLPLWADGRSGSNLWVQRFNSSGEPQGQNYRINIPLDVLGSRYDLDIHGNTVGIGWVDFRNEATYGADIYAKLLDLDVIGYYLPGDVVLDGKVDLTDVIYLCNYLLKSGWGILPLWPADVNADSSINLGDVIYLANYLFKGGPPPQDGDM